MKYLLSAQGRNLRFALIVTTGIGSAIWLSQYAKHDKLMAFTAILMIYSSIINGIAFYQSYKRRKKMLSGEWYKENGFKVPEVGSRLRNFRW